MFGWLKKKEVDTKELFFSTISQLVTLSLVTKYEQPKDSFGNFMTNKVAAGYLFGMHDALLQRWRLVDRDNSQAGLSLMQISYQRLFGTQAGYVLISMSIHNQSNADFIKGRMSGGVEVGEFLENRIPPMGLNRILIFGLSE